MDKSVAGFEKCNDRKVDMSQDRIQRNRGDPFPFPGFIVNNKVDYEDHTPIGKMLCGSVPDSAKSSEQSSSTATTKTPPAEPSVSPEIQSNLCRSVLVSGAAPSTCYGFGHVISGVVDKRKCKARGILSVGHKEPLEQEISGDSIHCFSNDKRGKDIFSKSRPSMIPFPVEASISWHLSPSYVDKDENDNFVRKIDSPKPLHQSWNIVESSPSSPCESPCTLSSPDAQGVLETSSEKVVNKLSSTSPCDEHVMLPEERPSSFDFSGESSPFSANSLGSGNVMQTPNSDSSLERHAPLSWMNEGMTFETELDQVTNDLHHKSLFPKDNSSPWDPSRLNVELAELSSLSDLINPKSFIESLDVHASWISNSTSENVSESQMRVSWRDGLISGSFDKEDLDCCRLLSDEETDADGLLKSPRLTEHEVKEEGNGKGTSFPTPLNPCAESICSDDGGVLASDDSGWTMYYKNRSFAI
uniref:uncharacterized protein LOC122603736 n=1 Tax=Erigeron canadensis TaxID=72917 RepID=UPI001CB94608|nr:uncharacterized protein LOC122603736 [Erigeron canadensis]